MPEAAEVAITAAQLDEMLAGHTVAGVVVGDTRAGDAAHLDGETVTGVSRVGKWLAVHTTTGVLWVHLGIAGRIEVSPPQPRTGHRTRFAATTTSELVVAMVDLRRFGRIVWGAASSVWPPGAELGADVYGDTATAVVALTERRRPVKVLLCDQSVLAGVGNYVADEALFRAGIAPDRRQLSPQQAARVVDAAVEVAADALGWGGHSMRDWWAPDGTRGEVGQHLEVYRRGGEPCVRCGEVLWSTPVGGRTSTWCRSCQR